MSWSVLISIEIGIYNQCVLILEGPAIVDFECDSKKKKAFTGISSKMLSIVSVGDKSVLHQPFDIKAMELFAITNSF